MIIFLNFERKRVGIFNKNLLKFCYDKMCVFILETLYIILVYNCIIQQLYRYNN